MTNQHERPDKIETLEAGLDDFDPQVRRRSFLMLLALVKGGRIACSPPSSAVNLHCHSFFSYNGYGYSPTHLAWLAKKMGLAVMGVVDFDVLDGVDEFLLACDLCGVRGTAGIETRVMIPEFRTLEINSPGEPGVAYHMGVGFIGSQLPDLAAPALANLRQRAASRNLEILERVNAFLAPLAVDYAADVLPLTPSGTATERHMVGAIADKAAEAFDDPTPFWAGKLALPEEELRALMQEDPKGFQNLLRKRLMKRGGVGYIQPVPESFPTVDEFHAIVLAGGAIPCLAWLDGTSSGEQEIESLLDLLMAKGVAAVNIIPERNWHIADPDMKQRKLKALYQFVTLAEARALPVLVGTEMNSPGKPLVDDFAAPELAPLREVFMQGAYFLYGHTCMARWFGMGYQSLWAESHLPERTRKNEFYESVGRLAAPGAYLGSLAALFMDDVTPDFVLKTLTHYHEEEK
jgi:hypothetical protein